MKHRRVWLNTELYTHPDECRDAGTWCEVCGCCQHCFHRCLCTTCSCSITGVQTEPVLHVVEDET